METRHSCVVVFIVLFMLQCVFSAETESGVNEMFDVLVERIDSLEARDVEKNANIAEMQSEISGLKFKMDEMELKSKQKEATMVDEINELRKTLAQSSSDTDEPMVDDNDDIDKRPLIPHIFRQQRSNARQEWGPMDNTPPYYHVSTMQYSYCDAVAYCENIKTQLAHIDTSNYSFLTKLWTVVKDTAGDNFVVWVSSSDTHCPAGLTLNAATISYFGALVHMPGNKSTTEHHLALCSTQFIPTAATTSTMPTTMPTTMPQTTESTMPSQTVVLTTQPSEKPAFSASLSSHSMNLGNYQTIIFDNAFTNNIGAYSSVTGIFTVPKNGTYFFTATVMSHSGQYLETEICLNGKSLVFMYSSDAKYEQGTNSVVLVLKAGDSVWVRHRGTEGSNAYGGHWSTFSGFMI